MYVRFITTCCLYNFNWDSAAVMLSFRNYENDFLNLSYFYLFMTDSDSILSLLL